MVSGDYFITQALTSPGSYAITVSSDGTVAIAAGGDTSRQKFFYYIWRVATNIPDGSGLVYVNEKPPVWNNPPTLPPMTVGVAIAPVFFASPIYAVSPAGDAMVFTISGGAFPAGLTLSSMGILTGTPTIQTTVPNQVILTATDTTGMSTASPVGYITVVRNNGLMPNVLGSAVQSAITTLQANGVNIITISSVNSLITPAGFIAGQFPTAGVVLAGGQAAILYESLGASVIQEEYLT